MQQIEEKKQTKEAFNLNNKITFNGSLLSLDVTTHIGRMCARLCAYMLLAAGDREAAEILFHRIGH